jgi:hypothetical protein
MVKVRAGVFAQLDCFLFGDNTFGIERTRGATRFTAS